LHLGLQTSCDLICQWICSYPLKIWQITRVRPSVLELEQSPGAQSTSFALLVLLLD
jgi:hypothetical protein